MVVERKVVFTGKRGFDDDAVSRLDPIDLIGILRLIATTPRTLLNELVGLVLSVNRSTDKIGLFERVKALGALRIQTVEIDRIFRIALDGSRAFGTSPLQRAHRPYAFHNFRRIPVSRLNAFGLYFPNAHRGIVDHPNFFQVGSSPCQAVGNFGSARITMRKRSNFVR